MIGVLQAAPWLRLGPRRVGLVVVMALLTESLMSGALVDGSSA
jgi:hypothetical protein